MSESVYSKAKVAQEQRYPQKCLKYYEDQELSLCFDNIYSSDVQSDRNYCDDFIYKKKLERFAAKLIFS